MNFVLRMVYQGTADLWRAPVWWYGRGFLNVAQGFREQVRALANTLSLSILIRHLLTPMFGDYSRSGRLISLMVRLGQIVVYMVIMTIGVIAFGVVLVVWLLFPFVVLYHVILQLIPNFPNIYAG